MKTLFYILLAVFTLQTGFASTPDTVIAQSSISEITDSSNTPICGKDQKKWEWQRDRSEAQPIWKRSLISNIAPFIFVVLVVLIMQIGKHLKRKQMNELALRYIELGKDIPQDLFKEEKDVKNPLKIGIILSSIGVGMFVMFAIFLDLKMSSIAAVPFFLGLGFILIDFIERKHRSNNKQVD